MSPRRLWFLARMKFTHAYANVGELVLDSVGITQTDTIVSQAREVYVKVKV
jgi:hypothetical protein